MVPWVGQHQRLQMNTIDGTDCSHASVFWALIRGIASDPVGRWSEEAAHNRVLYSGRVSLFCLRLSVVRYGSCFPTEKAELSLPSLLSMTYVITQ